MALPDNINYDKTWSQNQTGSTYNQTQSKTDGLSYF